MLISQENIEDKQTRKELQRYFPCKNRQCRVKGNNFTVFPRLCTPMHFSPVKCVHVCPTVSPYKLSFGDELKSVLSKDHYIFIICKLHSNLKPIHVNTMACDNFLETGCLYKTNVNIVGPNSVQKLLETIREEISLEENCRSFCSLPCHVALL